MKMKKKIVLILLLALMLLVAASLLALAAAKVDDATWTQLLNGDSIDAAAGQRVYDYAGLFSDSEMASLEQQTAVWREQTGMDVVILTTSAPHDYEGIEVADDFYDYNGFGVGSSHSGMLYYIDMYNRIPTISTTGDMKAYLGQVRLEASFERSWNSLSQGKYAQAAQIVLGNTAQFVAEGAVDESQLYYDAQRDQIRRQPLIAPIMYVIALAVGAAVYTVSYSSRKRQYQLKNKLYHYSPAANSDADMSPMQQQLINQTVVRVPRPTSNGGGGGSRGGGGGGSFHVGSSGTSHGGGSGRGF